MTHALQDFGFRPEMLCSTCMDHVRGGLYGMDRLTDEIIQDIDYRGGWSV